MKIKCLSLILSLMLSGAVYGVMWIDVRPQDQHFKDAVADDLNLQVDTIVRDVKSILRFKDYKKTEIALYIETGEASAEAKQLLEAAGFTNVSNAGSVEEALKLRGLFIE